jgi:hypothetical protein
MGPNQQAGFQMGNAFLLMQPSTRGLTESNSSRLRSLGFIFLAALGTAADTFSPTSPAHTPADRRITLESGAAECAEYEYSPFCCSIFATSPVQPVW